MSKKKQARTHENATLVKQIANTLGEQRTGPLTIIRRIIKTLGAETSLAYLQRTLEIEEQGGLISAEGKRRTPGGVFFHLIKTERPKEEIFPIFWLKPYLARAEQTERPAPTAPRQALTWEERGQALAQGERTHVSVTITLRGQPLAGSIIDTGTCIICTLQNTKGPNTPKGVPAPPEEPTAYDVYISYKLWKRVAEAAKDEEDSLIIDGYPRLDDERHSIAVIATGASSNKLKAAEKAPKPTG